MVAKTSLLIKKFKLEQYKYYSPVNYRDCSRGKKIEEKEQNKNVF